METSTLAGLLLMPQQPSPVDGDPSDERFTTPPFTIDEQAYAMDASFPAQPAGIREGGWMRDLRLLLVDVAPYAYNPSRREVTLHRLVHFRIRYESDGGGGGSGAFLPARAADPFESHNARGLQEAAVLNGNLLYRDLVFQPAPLLRIGAELIIVTPPHLLVEAERLAAWKREKGITTIVREAKSVAAGGVGTTKTEIRAFILDEYMEATPRPSYVLLFGDAEFVETFYRSSSGSLTTGTDLDYGLMTPGDMVPDLGVARIPVDTEEQARVVVDKIIGYERTPPFTRSFYGRVAMAAYFQAADPEAGLPGVTTRGYIRSVEQVRDALVPRGYSVERLYMSDTTYEPGYVGDPTPRFYADLTPLPAAIGPASGFPWDATGDDVIDYVNDGCFLLVHRDHGSEDKWVKPELRTEDVSGMHNGSLLPVLFSIDCATGLFDNETAFGDYGTTPAGTYLLEAMLRLEGGGVVGALGDTRDSPSWPNNVMLLGFADAVFPEVLPGEGTDRPIHRLADILNHGKLAVMRAPFSMGAINSEVILWHAFGDPTLEMWTSPPEILPPDLTTRLESARRLVVTYPEPGAVITVMQHGLPLGRARVEAEEAVIDLLRDLDPKSELSISASRAGAIAAQFKAEPPPAP
jgi:hypothetical protein